MSEIAEVILIHGRVLGEIAHRRIGSVEVLLDGYRQELPVDP